MVEEGEPDPEFESILDTVDPNRCVGWTFYFFIAKYCMGIPWERGWQVSGRLSTVFISIGERLWLFLQQFKKKSPLKSDLMLTASCV